jgi:hypothetical protein
MDGFSLTDTVASSHCLKIRRRVPIRIHQNARVCGLQVQPHTTAASDHEKEKLLRIRCIKRIYNEISLGSGRATVKAAILPASQSAIVVENVQDEREL